MADLILCRQESCFRLTIEQKEVSWISAISSMSLHADVYKFKTIVSHVEKFSPFDYLPVVLLLISSLSENVQLAICDWQTQMIAECNPYLHKKV